MSSDTVFRIDELRKEFGGLVAVDDLSFDLQDDEILGLIGPNGSGKSTVFNCIMGIYDVTAGSVQFRTPTSRSWIPTISLTAVSHAFLRNRTRFRPRRSAKT